jgi:hypothetical protein
LMGRNSIYPSLVVQDLYLRFVRRKATKGSLAASIKAQGTLPLRRRDAEEAKGGIAL